MVDPVLLLVIKIVISVAAVTTTSFPILYLRSPWTKTWLGRVMMIQAAALAMAIDLSFVQVFFLNAESRPFLIWVNLSIITTIALTSAILTYLLWTFQDRARRRKERNGSPSLAGSDEADSD